MTSKDGSFHPPALSTLKLMIHNKMHLIRPGCLGAQYTVNNAESWPKNTIHYTKDDKVNVYFFAVPN